MLVGLLLYDVFWVFGSPKVVGDNVMLAVATSDVLSGPTRLLFPRFQGSLGEGSGFPFSLLGARPSSCGTCGLAPKYFDELQLRLGCALPFRCSQLSWLCMRWF
jgi:hypothetical protein